MPSARICPLAEVAHRLPAGSPLVNQADGLALHITDDVYLTHLDLNHPLTDLGAWVDGALPDGAALGDAQLHGGHHAPARGLDIGLVLIEASLYLNGSLTANNEPQPDDGNSGPALPAHIVVTGSLHARNAVLAGTRLDIDGALHIADLLWCQGDQGMLAVRGAVHARVAVFTGGHGLHFAATQDISFLIDEVRGGPHLAEFSCEAVGAVFPTALLNGLSDGEHGVADLLDRKAVLAAVRSAGGAARSSEAIRAALPMADEGLADSDISIHNIRAALRSPVIPHKQFTAMGWFGQTDFLLCRQHEDANGDACDDHIHITVWKTWDFHLSVQKAPVRTGLRARLAAGVRLRRVPKAPRLTLAFRAYSAGQPGPWQPLDASHHPDAWQACTHAWRGVLDYVRRGVGQHRARYPLLRQLQAEITAAAMEDFTSLPVFAERCSNWWDDAHNGWWEGNVWLGARQPCMHDGEPWGRALKFSWKNGEDAPGDPADHSHSAYQMDVDEAREGPPVVAFTYAQRQGEQREPFPPCAADHIARLLRFYRGLQARLHAAPEAAPD
ncbi:hypothetical protein [Acidovorax sp.]|uniref:hypothetical protein n=1 Tax=Acidovorax sp. TaxID=1872122 RepID=UPI00391EE7E7